MALTMVLGNDSNTLVGVCNTTQKFLGPLEVMSLAWKTLHFTMNLIHFALIYLENGFGTEKSAISLRFGLQKLFETSYDHSVCFWGLQ